MGRPKFFLQGQPLAPYAWSSLGIGSFFVIGTYYWYLKSFQMMHIRLNHSVPVELAYFLISPITFSLGLIAAFYGLLNINKRLRSVILGSRIVSTLANISFASYLFHNCVVYSRMASAPDQFSINYSAILANFAHDFSYNVPFCFLLTLFVVLPLGRMFRLLDRFWLKKG